MKIPLFSSFFKKRDFRDSIEPSVREVSELLIFAQENDIAVSEPHLTILCEYVEMKKEDSFEHFDSREANEANWKNNDFKQSAFCLKDVHIAYTQLCKKTLPVTGKTIIDSKDSPRVWQLFYLIIILVPTLIAFEVLRQFILEIPDADEIFPTLYLIDRYAYQHLAFFWAMLGSCIFLVKKHSDLAANYQFELHKSVNGWLPRVILGTVLGGISPLIFDFNYISDTGVDENSAAFLIGLSVKIFYGAIEKVINEIANRFNLSNIKGATKDKKSFEEEIVEAVKNGKLTSAEAQELLELFKKAKDDG
ncbi:hypothetical protein [Glaciecola sp. 1036]|uniref:hypothetical protein n=1 Tax=Alteromonadaceae TaxID=72275 RepID=UPI003D01412C